MTTSVLAATWLHVTSLGTMLDLYMSIVYVKDR